MWLIRQPIFPTMAQSLPVTIKSAKHPFQLFKLLPGFGELAFGSQALVIVEVFAGFGDERIGIR